MFLVVNPLFAKKNRKNGFLGVNLLLERKMHFFLCRWFKTHKFPSICSYLGLTVIKQYMHKILYFGQITVLIHLDVYKLCVGGILYEHFMKNLFYFHGWCADKIRAPTNRAWCAWNWCDPRPRLVVCVLVCTHSVIHYTG